MSDVVTLGKVMAVLYVVRVVKKPSLEKWERLSKILIERLIEDMAISREHRVLILIQVMNLTVSLS